MSKKVLHLCFVDYAGVGLGYSNATNRIGKYESNVVTLYSHKYGYSSDITIYDGFLSKTQYRSHLHSLKPSIKKKTEKKLKENFEKVLGLVEESDIIHLVGDFPASVYTEEGLHNIINKPIIATPGGSAFRRHLPKSTGISQARWTIKEHKKNTVLRTVGTPDLNYPEFDACWSPYAIDCLGIENEWMQRQHDIPLITHSPSSRAAKSTDTLFIPAIKIMKKAGVKFELDIIENVSNKESIERKRKSTIFFDQKGIGWYGIAALEAAQFGIPSLAWIDQHSINGLGKNEKGYKIISYKPTPKGLAQCMTSLITSDLSYHSRATKAWIDKTHSYEAVGKRLAKLYDKIS